MIIGIDFDGTIVENKFPDMGSEVPFAISTLKILQQKGHKFILWTVRADDKLEEAVSFLKNKGILLYGINNNPTQPTTSPKIYCHYYIDDRSIGCPLIFPKDRKPFVNWLAVEDIINKLRK